MSTGVVLGKFQTPTVMMGTANHLLSKAANAHEKLVIFLLIVPQECSKDHPLPYVLRAKMISDHLREKYPNLIFEIRPLRQADDKEELFTYITRDIKSHLKENEEPTVYVYKEEEWMLDFMNYYKSKVILLNSELKPEEELREKLTSLSSESRVSNTYFRSGWAACAAYKRPAVLPRVILLIRNSYGSCYVFTKTGKLGSHKLPNYFLCTKDKSIESSINEYIFGYLEKAPEKIEFEFNKILEDNYTKNTVDRSLFLVYSVHTSNFPFKTSSLYKDYIVCTQHNITMIQDKIDPFHLKILQEFYEREKQKEETNKKVHVTTY